MYTILVCDDQRQIRELLSEALGALRPETTVIEAVDGENVLEILAEKEVDLLFLDVDMPRLDGFSTLGRIRGHGINVYTVMVTGRNSEEDFVEGWSLDANGYVSKPFNMDEIRQAVEDFEKAHTEIAMAS